MSETKALEELLSQWDRGRAEGRAISAEELCVDQPELLAVLQRRIEEMQRLEQLARRVHDADHAADDESSPSVIATSRKGPESDLVPPPSPDHPAAGLGTLSTSDGSAIPTPLRHAPQSRGDQEVQVDSPRPAGAGAAGEPPSTLADVRQIAGLRFQVLRPHGKGGIGEVFVARDQELNREVALKEMQDPYARDAHSRGRFVREAEITGGLEHPGVVPVYGLGTYGDGRPFYAMRFIQGETLQDAIREFHAGQGDWTLRGLLTRFVTMCNTMGYAHSRGVLHRDLKPANVMLGRYGETLIVDWGLAKAGVSGQGSSARGLTEGGSDGLPEPALAPCLTDGVETQAGSALGTPSYMSPEQASGRLDLLGPASDIYSLGATLYTLLTGRPPIEGRDTVEVLRKAQRGEWLPVRQVKAEVPPALAAICQKAMALAPSARYATALEVAADVERWLADEPVSAHREAWTTRSRRWMRRHRTLMSTAVGVLVVALLGATVGLVVVSEAERKETAARKIAEAQKAKAEAISHFLIQDILRQAHPDANARNKQVTVEEALDRATEKIEGAFPGEPEIEASIRGMVGEVYGSLGLYEKAEPQLRKALELLEKYLGSDHPETLVAEMRLGSVFWNAFKFSEADAILCKSIEKSRRTLGPDHPQTLSTTLYLASVLKSQGRWVEGEQLARNSLPAVRRVFGPEHIETITAINILGQLLREQGKLDEAGDLFEQCIEIGRGIQGREYPTKLLDCTDSLARLRLAQGRLSEAEELFRGNWKTASNMLGPEHRFTLLEGNNLAVVLTAQGKWDEAERLLQQNYEVHRRTLGPEHGQTLCTVNYLAEVLQAKGNFAGAEELLRPNLEVAQRTLNEQNPVTLRAMFDLSAVLLAQGKAAEAEPLARRCRERQQTTLPRGHWQTALTENLLGGCLTDLHRYDEAEPLLCDGYRVLEASPSVLPAQRKEAVARCVRLFEAWQKPAEAAKWRAEGEHLNR
jgi:serine/threonine protein kinase